MPENQIGFPVIETERRKHPGKFSGLVILLLITIWVVFLGSCNLPPSQTPSLPPTPTHRATTPVYAVNTQTTTSTFREVLTPTITQTPNPTLTPLAFLSICSPLEGLELNELPGIIAGDTYQPPMPGRDDGHAGVDFAYYRRGTRTTMLGLPVKSALNGRVAAVINNRKPYGNMIIIETSIKSISQSQLPALSLPTAGPTVQPDPRLTCPRERSILPVGNNQRSIYVLYAHLKNPPLFHLGEKIICGQVIGEVGTTGNSVNPHLHFETRVGPAGISFDSLGHYDPATTELERSNYCIWRVSGWFQLFDPMLLLTQHP